jgi:hypothetical protein
MHATHWSFRAVDKGAKPDAQLSVEGKQTPVIMSDEGKVGIWKLCSALRVVGTCRQLLWLAGRGAKSETEAEVVNDGNGTLAIESDEGLVGMARLSSMLRVTLALGNRAGRSLSLVDKGSKPDAELMDKGRPNVVIISDEKDLGITRL